MVCFEPGRIVNIFLGDRATGLLSNIRPKRRRMVCGWDAVNILFRSKGVVGERASSNRTALWSLSYSAKVILSKPLGFKFFKSLR